MLRSCWRHVACSNDERGSFGIDSRFLMSPWYWMVAADTTRTVLTKLAAQLFELMNICESVDKAQCKRHGIEF
jgi:hypothetical protein